jgi:hypothetical protein
MEINYENGRRPMKNGSLSPRHGESSGYGWRRAANALYKQPRSAAWGLVKGLTIHHRKKPVCYKILYRIGTGIG